MSDWVVEVEVEARPQPSILLIQVGGPIRDVLKGFPWRFQHETTQRCVSVVPCNFRGHPYSRASSTLDARFVDNSQFKGTGELISDEDCEWVLEEVRREIHKQLAYREPPRREPPRSDASVRKWSRFGRRKFRLAVS